MKYLKYIIVAAGVMVGSCGHNTGLKHDHDHEHEGEHAEEAHEGHDHENHEGVIVIHDHQAEELGIKTTEVVATEFAAPLTVAGEVIYNSSNRGTISAPMSGKIIFDKAVTEGEKVTKGSRIGRITTDGMAGGDQLKAAKIEFEAAKKEVDRLTPLREEGLVTVGEYNAAVANMERARNNMAGGGGNVITAPMSGIITGINVAEGGYVNAGDVVAEVVGDGALTLRADVPTSEIGSIAAGGKANVKLNGSEAIVEVNAINSNVTASPSAGYVSLYYALPVMDNAVAGSFAEVYVPRRGTERVITVPVSAVTDRMGQKMVYVKEAGEEHYRRVPVTLGATDGKVVEVKGVEEGELVVTEGVTFVRLAENAGAVPPGHTHNH